MGKRRGCGICNSGANLQHQLGYYKLLIELLLYAECWNKDDSLG